MPGNVVFDEARDFDVIPLPRRRPPTIADMLVNARIAGSPDDAKILLAVATVVLIGLSFYFLISSVRHVPEASLSHALLLE